MPADGTFLAGIIAAPQNQRRHRIPARQNVASRPAANKQTAEDSSAPQNSAGAGAAAPGRSVGRRCAAQSGAAWWQKEGRVACQQPQAWLPSVEPPNN